MSELLLPILTFGSAIAIIVGLYSILVDLYLHDRVRVSQRIDDEFKKRQREHVRKTVLFKDLANLVSASGAARVDHVSIRCRFETLVEQSGMDVTPARVLAACAACGLCLGLLIGLLRQSFLEGLIAGSAGLAVPILYLHQKRKARREKLLTQLPEAFDLMARVMRAGQTLEQALQAVADEFPQPIAGEFSYCHEQQALGLPPDTSMRDLAQRTGVLEIKLFVTALIIKQQAGGNMAELLEKISTVIRQRFRIRGQIQTLTAEGRFQAIILLALPVVMFCLMMAMNRRYEGELLSHPRLILGTIFLEGIGAVWIRKIVNFDF